jgi:hypothetical protein
VVARINIEKPMMYSGFEASVPAAAPCTSPAQKSP